METAPVYLNGKFEVTEDSFDVINPGSGETIGRMSSVGRARVREAIASLGVGQPLVVRLHPEDYGLLSQQPPEVWANEQLTFSPDQAVTRGGAVVESPTQVVDARMEARLLEAARQILFPQDGPGAGPETT